MSEELTVFLTITAQQGARVPLTITEDLSASDLRKKASEATKIAPASLRLIFRGKMIKDDDTKKAVEEYKLENECVIHCMGKPSVAAAPKAAKATSTAASAPPPSVPTIATTPVGGLATTSPTQIDPLDAALRTIRSSNSASVYQTAVTTLDKILNNIISHPMEEKYRKVKKNNSAFQKRLGGLRGGDDAMKAAGFVLEQVDGEECYMMHLSPEAWPKLTATKAKVAAAASSAVAAAAPPPVQAAGSMPGGAFGGMGAGGGLPGGAFGGMPANVTPEMQSAMAQMMSNPEQMQAMLSNPMVQQMIQNDPSITPMMRERMQQLSSNPAMLNQLSQMMSNPAARAMMSQAMAQGGGAMPGMNGAPTATTNSNQSSSNQQQPSDQEMTEEEMIQEAIRRSLNQNQN